MVMRTPILRVERQEYQRALGSGRVFPGQRARRLATAGRPETRPFEEAG
jgi:hypothetical protein